MSNLYFPPNYAQSFCDSNIIVAEKSKTPTQNQRKLYYNELSPTKINELQKNKNIEFNSIPDDSSQINKEMKIYQIILAFYKEVINEIQINENCGEEIKRILFFQNQKEIKCESISELNLILGMIKTLLKHTFNYKMILNNYIKDFSLIAKEIQIDPLAISKINQKMKVIQEVKNCYWYYYLQQTEAKTLLKYTLTQQKLKQLEIELPKLLNSQLQLSTKTTDSNYVKQLIAQLNEKDQKIQSLTNQLIYFQNFQNKTNQEQSVEQKILEEVTHKLETLSQEQQNILNGNFMKQELKNVNQTFKQINFNEVNEICNLADKNLEFLEKYIISNLANQKEK